MHDYNKVMHDYSNQVMHDYNKVMHDYIIIVMHDLVTIVMHDFVIIIIVMHDFVIIVMHDFEYDSAKLSTRRSLTIQLIIILRYIRL